MRRFLHGFTLVELMVALALVGILATLAAPAFQGSMERSRADSDINELRTALSFARLEAINKSRSITVAATDADKGWAAGVTVKQGNAIVREFSAMKGGADLKAGDETELTFNNLGGVEEEVEFTYTRGVTAKTLKVCPTGRILMAGDC
ncbi:type IV fimbrial biogenesis protein FimU [Pseudomonas sp. URMO17WK12:I1]|uniref:GspH/FimT family pseudopilin n=1 Tax=unclassified Pseudomonas TaxID=196821 RepID=UPI0004821D2B|nr:MULTISPECIES: GspH/FimT family pseudopilin [unclassified Pseudomonas]PZW63813.1 type IV fimbrial biogenesis protein FimU [Pseudomonas sp. URMO17WK12:I1]